MRSQRLKQVGLKTQDEVTFLEMREQKRKQAMEEKKREALQEEKERLKAAYSFTHVPYYVMLDEHGGVLCSGHDLYDDVLYDVMG